MADQVVVTLAPLVHKGRAPVASPVSLRTQTTSQRLVARVLIRRLSRCRLVQSGIGQCFICFGVLLEQKLEDVCLSLAITYFNAELGLLECVADALLVLEEHPIESVRERDHCVVTHFLRLLDTNDVFGARLLENPPYELRVARRDEDELQLAPVLPDHLFQLLSTH